MKHFATNKLLFPININFKKGVEVRTGEAGSGRGSG